MCFSNLSENLFSFLLLVYSAAAAQGLKPHPKVGKSHASHGGESGSKVIALICSTIKEIKKNIIADTLIHTRALLTNKKCNVRKTNKMLHVFVK